MALENREWGVVLGGVVVSLGAAFWANSNGLAAADVSWISWLPKIAVLVVFLGAVFAYLSRDFYGGEVARSLEVIAAGFMIYAVIWWPHKMWWHGGGTPAWGGIIEPAWQTFFHLLTAVTLLIVAYGFYLFWQSADKGGDMFHE